ELGLAIRIHRGCREVEWNAFSPKMTKMGKPREVLVRIAPVPRQNGTAQAPATGSLPPRHDRRRQ
ncbi:MAG: hypothetical protein KA806_01310, partial [Sulfuritalea sp.]|nr:hypothetical protein [Sulfuritalea sp.]